VYTVQCIVENYIRVFVVKLMVFTGVREVQVGKGGEDG